MIYELAEDFAEALLAMPGEHPRRRMLELLEEGIRRDIHFLARYREDQPQALFQCLWNSGWWYDGPETAVHYQPAEFAGRFRVALGRKRAGDCGPWEQGGMKLSELMEGWRRCREQEQGAFPWLRALRPPAYHLGSAQRRAYRGHEGGVCAVICLAGGARMASASEDKTLRIWDAESGQALECIPTGETRISSLAGSPDGETMAGGGDDGMIRLWSMAPVREIWAIEGHQSRVNCIDFAPDGATVASGGRDGLVRIWNAGSGELIHELAEGSGPVTGVEFSPDGRWIASVGRDRVLRVWEAAGGRVARRLKGHRREPTCVCWSPDGRLLASGSLEGALLWDSEARQRRRLEAYAPWVEALCFSSDGGQLIGGGNPFGSIWVWDVTSGKLLRTLNGHDGAVHSLRMAGHPGEICSGSLDGTVRRWDVSRPAQQHVLRGHLYAPGCMAFSPDGQRIATGAGDCQICLWDAVSGRILQRLKGHRGTIYAVAYSPDGRWLASTSYDRTVRIWQVASGRLKLTLKGLEEAAHEACFSGDGTLLATRGANDDVRIWGLSNGRLILALNGIRTPIKGVKYITDRRLYQLETARGVSRWDPSTGKCVEGRLARMKDGADDGRKSPWRAALEFEETRVIAEGSGKPLACYPAALPGGQDPWTAAASPAGPVWAGVQDGHLQIIRLEGVGK